ncbi:MAG: radical SAM protein [Candidatus Latescibacterota bacterium]
MRVLFIESRVSNPVRLSVAIPMTFLALYSYAITRLEDVEFFYHSLELDCVFGNDLSLDSIYNNYKPDIVMCTAVSCNFNSAIEILRFFKGKNTVTIIGGIFPSANDIWILNNFDFIDIVVKGEGERTLVEVLRKIKDNSSYNNVSGISYRHEASVCTNQNRELIGNLDELPPTLYDKIPVNMYKKCNTRYYVFASRGCCYDCDFCSLASHWQRKHRRCSIDRVLEEIAQLIRLFEPKRISFGDDTLALDSVYFRKLCENLASRAFPVQFGGKTRIDLINPEYLNLMRVAGFREISFGVESNNPEQLHLLNKKSIINALDSLDKILQLSEELKYRINLNFILGTPGETVNTLNDKAEFIIKHCSSPKVIPLLSFITPHRGTKLFMEAEKIGLKIVDHNYDHYNHLQPVCLPDTLGINGMSLLRQVYNEISKETNSEEYNPLLEG